MEIRLLSTKRPAELCPTFSVNQRCTGQVTSANSAEAPVSVSNKFTSVLKSTATPYSADDVICREETEIAKPKRKTNQLNVDSMKIQSVSQVPPRVPLVRLNFFWQLSLVNLNTALTHVYTTLPLCCVPTQM